MKRAIFSLLIVFLLACTMVCSAMPKNDIFDTLSQLGEDDDVTVTSITVDTGNGKETVNLDDVDMDYLQQLLEDAARAQIANDSSNSVTVDDSFRKLITSLENDGVIPSTNGSYIHFEDYTYAWAQIDWYSWNSMTDAKNFVLDTTVSWESAAERPNTFDAGCGLVFRENGASDMLSASLRMDGNVYLTGYYNNRYLSYGIRSYGPAQIEATHEMTVVANDGMVYVFVDGKQIAKQYDVAIQRSGNMGFATHSGTNKDFGTRCTFEDVNVYVFD